jgi:choline dehydrogenase-like flavoprotein
MDASVAIQETEIEDIEGHGAYDAVVIGSGASGGLAAALLTQAGLDVLVLDAGFRRPFWRTPARRGLAWLLQAVSNPRAIEVLPPALLWHGERALRRFGRWRQPIQSRCYAWPGAPEAFVDDRECPYTTPPDMPFNWIRVHGMGGRMEVPAHGRQYYRHGPRDFAPTDGLSPPWPFDPDALTPYYERVEGLLGMSGRYEGCPWVPDSRLAEVRVPTKVEAALMASVTARFPSARTMLGRHAPPPRSLAIAAATGRLRCRRGAVARHIELDRDGRAGAVGFHDRRRNRLRQAKAARIFLCASTLESTRILMSSVSDRTPGGIGGRSNALGRNLMDHVAMKFEGVGPDLVDRVPGLTPGSCVYLPRFDLRAGGDGSAGRGFSVRIYQVSARGAASYFVAASDGEMLPRPENRVRLSGQTDAWGLPTLYIEARHGAADLALAADQAVALQELADVVGVRLTRDDAHPGTPGSAIHECGTARMGDDPATSVLDPFNQCWDAPGVYVTDGAAFPSEGLQNPTLTIMALTARACDHAVRSA